jgi:hypothetical protein
MNNYQDYVNRYSDWHSEKERSKREEKYTKHIIEEGKRLQEERRKNNESDDWWNPWR